MSYCKAKGCGAKIIWIKTENGKPHPIDEESEKRWVCVNGQWLLLNTHRTHFETCKKVENFRKPNLPYKDNNVHEKQEDGRINCTADDMDLDQRHIHDVEDQGDLF